MYEPEPLTSPTGAVAANLASACSQGKLTIYAGAGLSAAEPTSLPGAAGLANLLVERLSYTLAFQFIDRWDLVAVADHIASTPQGPQLLRRSILAGDWSGLSVAV